MSIGSGTGTGKTPTEAGIGTQVRPLGIGAVRWHFGLGLGEHHALFA
jgi:hypothetical protein